MPPTQAPIRPADHLEDEGDLAPLLLEITPPGAPALACWVDDAFDPCVLPLTNPTPQKVLLAQSGRPPFGWLEVSLSALEWERLGAEQTRRLSLLLSAGPKRADGLPGWEDKNRNEGQSHAWAYGRRNLGALGRAMIAAVAADLHDWPKSQVSELLGLHDHELQSPGGAIGIEARGARRYVSRGRKALGALGTWPWTHGEAGRLPAAWRSDPSFVAPLANWHSAACAELESQLATVRFAFDLGSRRP